MIKDIRKLEEKPRYLEKENRKKRWKKRVLIRLRYGNIEKTIDKGKKYCVRFVINKEEII